jgi:hypothetical protein
VRLRAFHHLRFCALKPYLFPFECVFEPSTILVLHLTPYPFSLWAAFKPCTILGFAPYRPTFFPFECAFEPITILGFALYYPTFFSFECVFEPFIILGFGPYSPTFFFKCAFELFTILGFALYSPTSFPSRAPWSPSLSQLVCFITLSLSLQERLGALHHLSQCALQPYLLPFKSAFEPFTISTSALYNFTFFPFEYVFELSSILGFAPCSLTLFLLSAPSSPAPS